MEKRLLQPYRRVITVAALALTAAFFGMGILPPAGREADANHIPFANGDVFAGIGDGKIKHFDSAGTLLETLDTTTGASYPTGMTFDASGNLYATWIDVDPVQSGISKFDSSGGLMAAQYGNTNGVAYFGHESIVMDAAGQFYVGLARASKDIIKIDSTGNLLATYNSATGSRVPGRGVSNRSTG